MNFEKHVAFLLIYKVFVNAIIKSVSKSLEENNSTAKNLSAEKIFNDMEYYDVRI